MWPWRQVCALTALQTLWLRCNSFRDEGAAALAAEVPVLAQLQHLDVACCGLTVAGALAQALWRLPRLQQLACEQFTMMERTRRMTEPFEVPAYARAPGLELVQHIE